ncbi:MAG TPA: hypothetical protein DDZ51_12520 [Planctomycetaceae bacterium]|nr:hypothetical protein [Planctomycetaceae bacterium]
MMDAALLTLIRCPVDYQPLAIAPDELIAKLNELVAQRQLRDQTDGLVEQPMDQALITADASRIYPVRGGIPALIPSESIPVPKHLI